MLLVVYVCQSVCSQGAPPQRAQHPSVHPNVKEAETAKSTRDHSEYVNTRPLACGDLKLPVDQLISKSLAQFGDLKFEGILNIAFNF